MVSNTCALSDAGRSLLIQVSLIVPALERKMPMYHIVKKRVLNPTEILGYNTPTTSATHAAAPCAVSAAWRWRWASRTPRAAARAIDEVLSPASPRRWRHR